MSRARSAADLLLLATLLTATWHRIAFEPFGRVTVADALAAASIAAIALTRPALRREARTLALIGVLTGAVYAAGALVTADTGQFAKGLVVWALWFSFAVAAVAHLGSRPMLYRRALVVFVAGFAANAAYGYAQYLLGTTVDVNLDEYLIDPFFSGSASSGLNLYASVPITQPDGSVTREAVYRITALTNDPNHIGILVVTPILLALALATSPARRPAIALAALVAALVGALALSQSRSALVGLAAGLLALAALLRGRLLRPALLWPAAALAAAVTAVVATRFDYWQGVVTKRLNPDTPGSAIHTQIYETIPDVLGDQPFLGLGLNTFAPWYEQVSGRADFGPHSFYVQVLTETGLLGATAVLVLAAFITRCLLRTWRAGDRALAAGLGAALVGTLGANVFYLTTIYPSWYALLALSAASAAVATNTASS